MRSKTLISVKLRKLRKQDKNTRRGAYLFLLFILLVSSSFADYRHEYYVSICQIDHNEKTKSLEITFRIFIDDLEKALKEETSHSVYLNTNKEQKNADTVIATYLQSKVQVVVNEKARSFRYVGKEYENDVMWCYVEIPKVKSLKKIGLTNKLLIQQFDSQINIVNVHANGNTKGLYLDSEHIKGQLSW